MQQSGVEEVRIGTYEFQIELGDDSLKYLLKLNVVKKIVDVGEDNHNESICCADDHAVP